MENIAVTKFREYLRVNTEQPNPDYGKFTDYLKVFILSELFTCLETLCGSKQILPAACQNFLFNLADELGIQRRAVETVPGKPFIIMTIPGTQPQLKSLMLYSHTDVVPTFKDQWKYDPYSAYKDENGDIYGRGTQDMKCVGSQYFEAIRLHFQRGRKRWLRTIHIVWGPDEEIAGPDGMATFCQMDEFRELNVGFVLDEGIASENDTYKVFYGERCTWWLKVTCHGSPGHGSKFIENTAGEKLNYVMNKALAFREEQRAHLKNSSTLTLGDVTTLNLTILEGGVQTNVLPEKFEAYFDIRITPTVDFDEFEKMIAGWCSGAGEGVTYEFLQKDTNRNVTPTTTDDLWWNAFEKSLKDEKLSYSNFRKCKFTKEIFTAATDSRFIRALGYRSIGFSPIINTPQLLHDHNEYLNERVFLRGVEIYETLIENLANVQEFDD
ncbi:unnamed protein product [Haemonchus placei]|uniref:N-acyl-aliphatic-L-amino acid amidohydrolase n=1 Tax=Haemonchus placei TaxID=6290 RepID=A0A0N4X9D1_HAEPC|nr:unnamed protein product [Haemonchus placei]